MLYIQEASLVMGYENIPSLPVHIMSHVLHQFPGRLGFKKCHPSLRFLHQLLVRVLPHEREGPYKHPLEEHVCWDQEIVETGSRSEDEPRQPEPNGVKIRVEMHTQRNHRNDNTLLIIDIKPSVTSRLLLAPCEHFTEAF
jgi:hypothetical protein